MFRLLGVLMLLALVTGVMGLAPAHAIGILYAKLNNAVNPSGSSYTAGNTGAPTSATISDLAGNPLTDLPYTSGPSYTIDKTAPTVVSILCASACTTSLASVGYIVTFSEDVTGVDMTFEDFTLTASSGISGAAITARYWRSESLYGYCQ